MSDDINKVKSEKLKVKSEEKTAEKVDSKLQKIIDEVAKLTVLELSDLVKAMEEKFGVQAMTAVAPSTGGSAGATSAGEPAEEKTTFTVAMTDSGTNKINVIKALREIRPELGLKEAKDMTEQLPAEVIANIKKEQAEEAKKKLEEAGAKIELK